MMKFDVVVIGRGAAGSYAREMAESLGLNVAIVDDGLSTNAKEYGTVWEAEAWTEAMMMYRREGWRRTKARHWTLIGDFPSTVWGLFPGFEIGLTNLPDIPIISAESVIVATGTVEKIRSFPGSDLPGVMTGRGLRRLLLKHQVWPAGRRVAIVGDGSDVTELASTVSYCGGVVVAQARLGVNRLECLSSNGVVAGLQIDSETIDTDIVAICDGEQPDTSLAAMIGCEIGYSADLGGFVPRRNERLETSVPGVFVCGGAAGVGTYSERIREGRLAAICAAYSLGAFSDIHLTNELNDFRTECAERVEAAANIDMTWVQHDVSRSVATPVGEF